MWVVRDWQEIEVAVDTTGNAFTLDGRAIELTDEELEEAMMLWEV